MLTERIAVLIERDKTLQYDIDKKCVLILDRRKLPEKIEYIKCYTSEDVAKAIEDMVIQGAIPIAYAAGYGMALSLVNYNKKEDKLKILETVAQKMKNTRPTGSILFKVVDKLLQIGKEALQKNEDPEIAIVNEVKKMILEEQEIARKCGINASKLLDNDDTILTHCLPGPALYYMLEEARNQNKNIKVFSTETRPYLQGARLTAYILKESGFNVTLITDNMVAYCMWKGIIKKYFTAADRIALDGSIANKVGTYLYALIAHTHNVPYFVLGYSGPDKNTPTYKDIPIEERDPNELFYLKGIRIAPEGINGYYPAFDIVPSKYISSIITDRGIFSPYEMKFYYEGELK
ncbi:MAG: s-methyl-5-thioribose-1-phosphate isomerase [Minisyncoccia bacterium]